MWEMRLRWAAAFLLLFSGVVTARTTKTKSPWLTLSGDAPVVVAKGGFSGMFPESSLSAYGSTYIVSSEDTVSWCDLQLTKDGVGICLPSMLLDNSTDIESLYPDGMKTYAVNGETVSGWFTVDFDMKSLSQINVIRSTLSRSDKFDSNQYRILQIEDVKGIIKSSPLWLNVQHDIFYSQHNLSMRNYLLSVSKQVDVNYVSSPEVAFLRSKVAKFRRSKTKLVFRCLEEDISEPTTNLTYGSLLKNLTFIRTFASGILVPKQYIWPVTSDLYLQPYTSLVLDAHKEGLEVFAADFANDASFSYNYSYDPVAEYLNYVDNGMFSIDGVLTDFPLTASEAIGCFSHMKKNGSENGKPIVITHNGASGIYAGCTDLAYQQAVEDGADFIDCPVQVTEDGKLICMSSINLIEDTTVATSPFRSRLSVIQDIQNSPGVFTFNLTMEEIQKKLKPAISNPAIKFGLFRNPRSKNAGNFVELSDFLAYAKGKSLSGILISIEHAAFLAENLEFSVTDGVISALNDAGYNNQTVQQVLIQSTSSSVLSKFKQQTSYKMVYMVDESISNADAASLSDIKKFASYVTVNKDSIYPVTLEFLTRQTDLVKNLHSAGFSVFVYYLRNEFVTQAWDFLSDPTVEINAFALDANVDGIITEFPGTALRYRRTSCPRVGDNVPKYMAVVQPGDLLAAINPVVMPPAQAPFPVLDAADVDEPPLPAASTKLPISTPPAAQPSAGPRQCTDSSILLSSAVMMMLTGFLVLLL